MPMGFNDWDDPLPQEPVKERKKRPGMKKAGKPKETLIDGAAWCKATGHHWVPMHSEAMGTDADVCIRCNAWRSDEED